MNKTGQSSIEAIKSALEALKAKGVSPTQLNISSETGLSVRTIKRHWAVVNDKDRVTPKSLQGDAEHKKISPASNRVTLKPGFERFKQRANSTPTTFTPFTIDTL